MADKQQIAIDAAAHADAVERERRMTLFRAGKLSFVAAEQMTAELCLQVVKRQREEQRERDRRQLGARLRGGTI